MCISCRRNTYHGTRNHLYEIINTKRDIIMNAWTRMRNTLYLIKTRSIKFIEVNDIKYIQLIYIYIDGVGILTGRDVLYENLR